MESYCQCLRCGKRIPIRPEMVGQTILCPSCLERVYVTPADQAPAKPKSSSLGTAEPSLSPSAEAALARLKEPGEASRSLPIGVMAGVGGAVALVVIVALVMWSSKSSPSGSSQAANTGASTPPQPSADSSGQAVADSAAKPKYGPISAEFLPKQPPGAPPTPFTSGFPSPTTQGAQPVVPGAQPVTPGGVLVSSASATGSNSSALPGMQPQLLGANWAELWRSPSTSSSEPAALGSMGDTPATWRVAARSYQPDLRTLPNVVVEAETDQRSWTVKYVPNPANPQATGDHEKVATLRREGPNLWFAWASPLASAEGRRNVSNCLLDVSYGTTRRVGQLREPVRAEPIVLDLATESHQVELDIDDPPRLDALRFEIVGLSGFSSEAQVRGGVKTAMAPSQPGGSTGAMPPGAALPGVPGAFGPMPMAMPLGMQALPPQQVVIECEEIPGFELRVRFARADASGKLTIAIDPVLNEGPKAEFDLSAPRILERLETEVQKPLAAAQRELGPAEAGLKRWQTDLEKLKEDEPRAKDVARHSKWEFNIRDKTTWVAKFEKEVAEWKQKIKTYQTRIEVVTKLRTFLKESHQHAQIHYVVYSECGQPDLLLLDARGQ